MMARSSRSSVVPDLLYIDIETYSDIDLKKVNVYRYTESPEFEILMASWALGDNPVQLALGWTEIKEIPGLWGPNRKVAHNAPFERVCFSRAAVGPGSVFLDPADWIDTRALAAEHGLPGGLDALAKALGAEEKDGAGTALINWFCKPDPRTGKRRRPEDHPEKWEQFKAYCIQDTETLRDVHKRLPDWPTPFEAEINRVDQLINDRGMNVDLNMAKRAVEVDDLLQERAQTEMREILQIKNAGSVVQIQKALNDTGLKIRNLRAETVEVYLAKPVLDASHRRALELRQLTALVASKKYQAVIDSSNSDSRYRGGFRFVGAHTGRWSSWGVQVHNLFGIKLSEVEVAARMLDFWLSEPTAEELKILVRSMFIIDGCVVDYNSIEARVLAWVAGEQWAIDAFRNNRDIYVETATRMGGLTRQQGKVAVLALGYQGGVGSLRNMGGDELGTDEQLLAMRDAWRKANPRIVRLWRSVENAFNKGGKVGRLEIKRVGRDRHLVLPSGRWLTYRNVKWERYSVQVEGQWIEKEGWRFDSPLGHRADTYGGRLVENATQAISRDILAHALVGLENAGYRTVGHVHDEAIVEGGDIEGVAKVMCDLPGWAKGLPVAAEGFNCSRYRKS